MSHWPVWLVGCRRLLISNTLLKISTSNTSLFLQLSRRIPHWSLPIHQGQRLCCLRYLSAIHCLQVRSVTVFTTNLCMCPKRALILQAPMSVVPSVLTNTSAIEADSTHPIFLYPLFLVPSRVMAFAPTWIPHALLSIRVVPAHMTEPVAL